MWPETKDWIDQPMQPAKPLGRFLLPGIWELSLLPAIQTSGIVTEVQSVAEAYMELWNMGNSVNGEGRIAKRNSVSHHRYNNV